MSYNIDTFRVKKLENLKIPVESFFTHKRNDWYPEKEYLEDGRLKLECGCEQEIIGFVEDEILTVESIDMSGEGSGSFIHYILEYALKNSTGTLHASCVWEGGDSINKLIVEDGNLSWEDIDI